MTVGTELMEVKQMALGGPPRRRGPGAQSESTGGHVLSAVRGTVGHVTLNRPEAINALTPQMIRALRHILEMWRGDPAVRVVLLDGAGDRGFCAGGDVRVVHHGASHDAAGVRALWWEEFVLDATLARYPKPVVTVASGITMGGGVGLACHASHRVATQTSVFAMPEVRIGLAPDVASLYLLARAPGETGTYAALTGDRLGAADALAMGLVDVVVAPDALGTLVDRLDDACPDEVLSALHRPPRAGDSLVIADRTWIDDCFSGEDPLRVLERLRRHPDPRARGAADTIAAASPTAVAVALSAVRRAAAMTDLRQCLVQDYRVNTAFLHHHDLVEGIRAQVVDKDRSPRWHPADLADVSAAMVAAFFEPVPDEAGLRAELEPI